MSVTIKSNILGIQPYVPGKPIEEVKRELGLTSVIKLASNESPFGPSPKVLRAMRAAAASVNRYPDGGCFYLRQALAKKWKLDPGQILFGNGSDEIIVMAIRAIVSPGEEVIVAKPSFLIYEIASRIEGATVRAVPLKNLRYDLPAMRAAVTPKTKIIFIGNPDNPAGTYVNDSELREFVAAVPENILIFVDEAYYEFVSAKDYPDSLQLVRSRGNVLVTRTFSKMYGLAGLRVGYGMGPRGLIAALERIREPFNINSIAQAAALACLADGAYYRRIARQIAAEKKVLCRGLKKLGVDYKESFTNFILIDLKKDSTQVAQALLKKGVIVRDMNFWGLKNFIRVTVGTKAENGKLLKTLKEVL